MNGLSMNDHTVHHNFDEIDVNDNHVLIDNIMIIIFFPTINTNK